MVKAFRWTVAELLPLVIELLCLVAIVRGLALVYTPLAWVVGGILGVVAVEYIGNQISGGKRAAARRAEAIRRARAGRSV